MALLIDPAGQIFRAVGFLTIDGTVSVNEAVDHFDSGDMRYEWDGSKARLIGRGADITSQLDEDRVASAASKLAKNTENLTTVNTLIRRQGEVALQANGIVCEGRNTSTAIFPETDLAFYVTASPEVRARRRYETQLAQGQTSDYDTVLANMAERDQRDKTRSSFPLGPIASSVIIDTTDLAVEEALQTMQSYIHERQIV